MLFSLMRKKLRGSYTVEASLIFPFILTVIVFIIFISAFLHDRAVMSSCAYQAALRASLVRTGDGDMKKAAERAAAYNIEGLLFMTGDVKTAVTVKGDEVTVTYEGTLGIPRNILFFPINGTEAMKVTGRGSAAKKDAVEFIRKCRTAENAARKIKNKNNGREERP